MDADLSVLGRQFSMLPLRNETSEQDSQVRQHLVESIGSTNDIERKILDACRTVENS